MKAAQVITPSVSTCSKDDSLEQAARIIWESDFDRLVVTLPAVPGVARTLAFVTERRVPEMAAE